MICASRGVRLSLALAGAMLGCPAAANAQAAYQVMHVFTGGSDGYGSFGALIEGADGNLYGTTQGGGTFGNGTVFRMTPAGATTVLYAFTGGADGALPTSALVRGSDGNFYGTTVAGGTGFGTTFRITPAGTFTHLHSFPGHPGANRPYAPLILAADGNFYGTTFGGGTGGGGTAYRMTPAGVVTTLHNFGGTTEGGNPCGGLVQATDGNFYGTSRWGVLFRLTQAGGFSILRRLAVGTEGATVDAPLVQGTDGSLYGVAREGGTTGGGTVFKITLGGAFTVLHTFTGGTDGDAPNAGLIQAPDGNLYGTTAGAYVNPHRRVFSITPAGTLTTLHSFASSETASYAPLLLASDGSFYGSTTGLYNGRSIVFRLTVGAMAVNRNTLQFGGTNAGGVLTTTSAQTVLATPPAGKSWTATPSVPWIEVSPAAGTSTSLVSVRIVNPNNVLPGAGSLTGSIVFRPPSGGIATVAVTLTLTASGATSGAFGVFETPADGSTGLTGSIPVTGWALDDLEVRQVRLLRDPVAGEGSAPIPIGTAVLVEGSRPDVASVYPTAPFSQRAGWGYLLLTNFLPNQGNGTFKLYAYADDVDGHSTLLGSKTMTCANSTATKPFGAIDTPAQGETVNGSNYTNFGWVLARGPARADPPFGTVRVVIDGVAGASPTGWTSRSDLTALFPQATYPGVTNALGVSTIDTTTLPNGVHTIAWVVTADNGQADGIGSRYFTVTNGSNLSAGARELGGSGARQFVARASSSAGVESEAAEVTGRRGWDVNTPLRTYPAGHDGRVTVTAEELDRIELHVGEGATGYMRAAGELGLLPIGSHLDSTTGLFTWAPGVGFVREYDLVFVRCGPDGSACARREVRIVLHPKGSTRVGPQVVIDTPVPGSDRLRQGSGESAVALAKAEDPGLQQRGLQQPFVVAGWAIDLDADIGTGVDTLHVWAYPVGGADPIFLGATAYGGSRPDVAEIFGERYAESGYGLTIDRLPPGAYDLAVFAWSTARHRFVPARVVRVDVR